MKRAWMPLYIGDYLGDTGHLTTTQHGAYLLLMMHYWRKDGLPDDDRQLAKITKLPLKIWVEYKEIIQSFFYEGWHHKRIDDEIAKMMRTSQSRSAAGYRGGIKSAMSRMKLEDQSLSKHVPKQAIAWPGSSPAVAGLDYSQSQSKKEGLGDESVVKAPQSASRADLEEMFAKRKATAS